MHVSCPQINYHQPLAGQQTCTICPVGTETFDQGNVQCSNCPKGYFNNVAGE